MKTIEVRLSTDSITQALRELRKYQRTELKKKMDTLCKRLAEVGLDVAQVIFAGAEYDGDNRNVVVTQSKIDNGYKIVASGKAVAFIEFGAGVTYGGTYPNDTKVPSIIPLAGSWSMDPEVGKGHWADPKGWYYAHGQRTLGNPPAMAMWYAREEMRRQIEQIAREVFQ